MYNRIIKNKFKPDYFKWIRDNYYTILSPRHRGIYAEMIFKKFCTEEQIMAIKINPFINVLDQIPVKFLTNIQQKELKEIQCINLDFFCIENNKSNKSFFVDIKMGTSNLSAKQKELVQKMKKNKVYLCRVFEDAEVFLKRIN